MISILIPANNEEGYIGPCLDLLLQSEGLANPDPQVQLIVIANGCSDSTIHEALSRTSAFAAKGWAFDVLDLEQGNKVNAINEGEAVARYPNRLYMDADIEVTPPLIAGVMAALDRPEPTFAGGRPFIRPAKSWFSERYARFWEKLPFMAVGVPGCGVYAVNEAGRQRWDVMPDVIADDVFVRMHFTTSEMVGTDARYSWPITEGLGNLIRVRRRQNEGLAKMHEDFPANMANWDQTAPDMAQKLRLLMKDPIGFVIYSGVALAVKLSPRKNSDGWYRGR